MTWRKSKPPNPSPPNPCYSVAPVTIPPRCRAAAPLRRRRGRSGAAECPTIPHRTAATPPTCRITLRSVSVPPSPDAVKHQVARGLRRAPAKSSPPTAATVASAVQMRKDGTSPAPVSLPDNDDLHGEILLRLPPLPSTLPRASLVCKRWRRLLSDPCFLRRFRAHHRKPPMLGFFVLDYGNWLAPVFTPTLPIPDRIPTARFSFPQRPGEGQWFLGCRHGLALLFNRQKLEAIVWDPITGNRCDISLPPELEKNRLHANLKFDMYDGAVLRDRHTSAFKLVMILSNELYLRAWACLYESESGKWGNIVSTVVPSSTSVPHTGVLIGNALCWVIHRSGGGVLEFDTDKQSLAVIQIPEEILVPKDSGAHVLRTEEGELGLAIVSEERIKLWKRTAISDHVVRWVVHKTIELDKLISLGPSMEVCHSTAIMGFDEDSNVIFVWTAIGVFMIQLESMKSTNISKESCVRSYYPFTSFYTPGSDIGVGDDRADMLLKNT